MDLSNYDDAALQELATAVELEQQRRARVASAASRIAQIQVEYEVDTGRSATVLDPAVAAWRTGLALGEAADQGLKRR